MGDGQTGETTLDTDDTPTRSPLPGTPEFEEDQEKQRQDAVRDACNENPILRVISTVFVFVVGGSTLLTAWSGFEGRSIWTGLSIAIPSIAMAVFWFSFLRYAWGKRRTSDS